MRTSAKSTLGLCPVFAIALALSGCGASISDITTGSLFGGKKEAAAPTALAQPDSVSRAIQVGTTSARAIKCGFNFDPVKLKTSFIAAETTANPAEATRVNQVYDVSFNGISRAVASKGEEYCSAPKTAKIKEALNRHLAGDYTPSAPEPVAAEDDGGLFGNASSSSNSNYKTPNPWARDE